MMKESALEMNFDLDWYTVNGKPHLTVAPLEEDGEFIVCEEITRPNGSKFYMLTLYEDDQATHGVFNGEWNTREKAQEAAIDIYFDDVVENQEESEDQNDTIH